MGWVKLWECGKFSECGSRGGKRGVMCEIGMRIARVGKKNYVVGT